jgi:hypothetical protein
MRARQTTMGVWVACAIAWADFCRALWINPQITHRRGPGRGQIVSPSAPDKVCDDRIFFQKSGFFKIGAAEVAIRYAMRYDSAKRQRNAP